MVIENTRSRVKIKSKLTNFKIKSGIEGYNGKEGSNPQGIREIFKISLNLNKSDDETVIEIGQFDILRKTTRR